MFRKLLPGASNFQLAVVFAAFALMLAFFGSSMYGQGLPSKRTSNYTGEPAHVVGIVFLSCAALSLLLATYYGIKCIRNRRSG